MGRGEQGAAAGYITRVGGTASAGASGVPQLDTRELPDLVGVVEVAQDRVAARLSKLETRSKKLSELADALAARGQDPAKHWGYQQLRLSRAFAEQDLAEERGCSLPSAAATFKGTWSGTGPPQWPRHSGHPLSGSLGIPQLANADCGGDRQEDPADERAEADRRIDHDRPAEKRDDEHRHAQDERRRSDGDDLPGRGIPRGAGRSPLLAHETMLPRPSPRPQVFRQDARRAAGLAAQSPAAARCSASQASGSHSG